MSGLASAPYRPVLARERTARVSPLYGLHPRVVILAFLFACELLVITTWLDGATLAQSAGIAALVRDWGPSTLRGIAGFAAIFLTFAYLKNRPALEPRGAPAARARFGWGLLAAHGCAMAVFARLSSSLYSTGAGGADALAASWLVAGIAAIVLGALAFLPWTLWRQLVLSNGYLWAYALGGVVCACVAGKWGRLLWEPASYATFAITKAILKPFVSAVVANPAALTLGTSRFHVIIARECSGLEGVGLMLAFGVTWLLLFRHECRFPRSLILLPAGVVVVFFLNAVRLAALVLIGSAGAKRIAAGGFHSQAGWILFNAVAVGFCVTMRRAPWFAVKTPPKNRAADNPTAAYLMPFLAILAAGMIASAAAGGFEWLYPLRLLSAAAALWFFRRDYPGLNWRFDWLAPAGGLAVLAMWIALDRFFSVPGKDSVPAALMVAAPAARAAWIGFRVLAATITVPVAEELAFRGFLLRRLVSADFESLPFQRVSWVAVAASSAIFGIMHGGFWLAGTMAGIAFALLAIRRGRIGDALVAHVTANALLAAYVLISGHWRLW